jgi:hypothetical protein
MKDWQSQAHVKWECKYHVVIPCVAGACVAKKDAEFHLTYGVRDFSHGAAKSQGGPATLRKALPIMNN